MHMSVNPSCHEYVPFQVNFLRPGDNGGFLPYSADKLTFNPESPFRNGGSRHYQCVLKKDHYCPFRWNFLNLSLMTPQKASPKIPLLIFEVPSLRFTNMIGTSVTLNPSL